MKQIIIFFITIFFLFGCSAKDEINLSLKKTLPLWYVNPPQSSQTKLYSVGEGESKEVALKNALNMMASTLSVSIESSYNSKKFVQEGMININQLDVQNIVSSSVRKIRISSYELLEYEEVGFRNHILLIQADKEKLFVSLKQELEQEFSMADAELKSLLSFNALEQISRYKKIKAKLEDMPDTMAVMSVLNNSFASEKYIKKLQKINTAYDELLSSITFEIKTDSASTNLEAPLRAALNAKKLESSQKSRDRHFKIFIKSDIQRATSLGFTLARSAIEISVEDDKGSIVAGNKLNLIGHSTQGYEIAKQSLSLKFSDMIKKEGIEKIIGLDF
ncbi:hypothetical protein Suden_0652 [Sulfurimonas denitrificans DSM 1251]|uniref:Lipoprotein LPP20-like domain-containing protein n=1 Tax=Sulfurimonas denitrificans (strain ATCC 33889 / DSM 1251) TaxID=326298 RepID=Q30SV0_SULDN|nr:LPP20 family lipoprotein [Sulfurimonas denitrificans]ABB43931.1 hypothetical protein Suden_0652 [Sulfurimonas denitrificans DSM 1251]MDD3443588.1 LPP20 family lipoprotein [Sulfurimonas denitrificans]